MNHRKYILFSHWAHDRLMPEHDFVRDFDNLAEAMDYASKDLEFSDDQFEYVIYDRDTEQPIYRKEHVTKIYWKGL